MRFYDLHVHPEVDLAKMLDFSKRLEWKGICLVLGSLKEIGEMRKSLSKFRDLEIFYGLKIETGKTHEMVRAARKARKKADVILVHGGNLEINRKAVETPEIDVLCHPELERNDSGLDHVMAKLAEKNNVAIEINFREFLMAYRKKRSDVFSRIGKNVRLIRKYRCPFILTSGAVSPWDLRSPSDLMSFGKTLGFGGKEVKHSLSGKIITENLRRLSNKWVSLGVEME